MFVQICIRQRYLQTCLMHSAYDTNGLSNIRVSEPGNFIVALIHVTLRSDRTVYWNVLCKGSSGALVLYYYVGPHRKSK
jgi:hypothetical protein